MLKLRGKQKHYLRSEAHHLKPLFSVGKNGLTDDWLNQLVGGLEKRELIKVNILQNAEVEPSQVRDAIQDHTAITVVQMIGHVLVLYLPAKDADYQKYSAVVEKM